MRPALAGDVRGRAASVPVRRRRRHPRREYRDGSPRVAAYLRRYHAPVQRWQPPAADTDAPEAEWGFAPGLRDDVAAFAARYGYRVLRLRFDQPEDLSPLVADLYRQWYRERGLTGRGGHFAGVSPRHYPADPRTFFGSSGRCAPCRTGTPFPGRDPSLT
ncbi:hypothetical protein [Actinoplanes sp. NPDC026619]|uniref:hypothetical protein n=1 Tax=Actinoplanes sp. NPDC026619 TaxID=3155798 RepID=UPI0033EFF173